MAVAVVLLVTVGSSKPKSDDDQIRALISKAADTNSSDVTAFRGLWCTKMQQIIDQVSQAHPDMKPPGGGKSHGPITVKSIQVNGDKATATITGTVNGRTRDSQMTFAKENGEWKLCL
ncbi:hypothetical protein BST20_23695 [Mycobacterium branderi]|uniref:Low molecular weight antigen MTB12-like C-terminal domain-containing protein n=1 Tax=Mycobacterium branderi TaxID=43348 RepID=A0AA91RG37_9MYCO|nr:hypothetical protein BST20_23695 [Mycobacterium branderi]